MTKQKCRNEEIIEYLSMSKLAELLKRKRKKLNYSLKQLSNRTGIDLTTLRRIESDNYVSSLSQINKLSKVLNFEINELVVTRNNLAPILKLKSGTINSNEEKGLDKLFSMMVILKQQIQLRENFEKVLIK